MKAHALTSEEQQRQALLRELAAWSVRADPPWDREALQPVDEPRDEAIEVA